MSGEISAKIAEIIREIGMSDPHVKGVVLSSSADAIPIKYYTSETSDEIVKDLTNRLVIAYSTFRMAATKIAKDQKIDNITLNMEREFVILKPIKNKYLLVVRGDKQANMGLIQIMIKKLAEELEHYL